MEHTWTLIGFACYGFFEDSAATTKEETFEGFCYHLLHLHM